MEEEKKTTRKAIAKLSELHANAVKTEITKHVVLSKSNRWCPFKKNNNVDNWIQKSYAIIKHFGKLFDLISVIKVTTSKITLIEVNTILNDEERLADLMNKNFINITKNLNLKPSTCNTTTDFDCVRKTCENHISVKI